MKEYKFGITEKMAEWLISEDIVTEDELLNCDEFEAGLFIDCYRINHNEKCMVYSKIVKNEATGIEMLDTIVGYLHEDYDSAKAREEAEMNENILDMEIDDYESYYEMAQVKWGFMSIKLAIYGKEGSYPHFHFYKECAPEKGIPEEKKASGGCLCIESANYFIHGTHTEKMNPKEIDGLIAFLRKKNRTFTSITNWEYIVGQWNDNNPDQKQLPVNIDIPDYRSDMNTIQEDKRKNK